MRPSDVLTAWERGRAGTVTGRAALLLAGLGAVADGELTVGQRDTLLLDLRRDLFGSEVTALAGCARCGEQVELTFDVDDVRQAPPSAPGETVRVVHGEYAVVARPPTVADVAALDGVDPAERRRMLLGRVVRSATHGGTDVAVTDLPAPVVADVAQHLSAADPGADIRLVLVCTACGNRWSAVFDIVDYLWDEVEHWALRLLRDVHALASAYGWAEDAILELSPARRALYLEQVRG